MFQEISRLTDIKRKQLSELFYYLLILLNNLYVNQADPVTHINITYTVFLQSLITCNE